MRLTASEWSKKSPNAALQKKREKNKEKKQPAATASSAAPSSSSSAAASAEGRGSTKSWGVTISHILMGDLHKFWVAELGYNLPPSHHPNFFC